jgi:hypothetical protein
VTIGDLQAAVEDARARGAAKILLVVPEACRCAEDPARATLFGGRVGAQVVGADAARGRLTAAVEVRHVEALLKAHGVWWS